MGINWRFHDASAALVDGAGTVHALAEEERYTRVKHVWNTLPHGAVAFCLTSVSITSREIDVVAVGCLDFLIQDQHSILASRQARRRNS